MKHAPEVGDSGSIALFSEVCHGPNAALREVDWLFPRSPCRLIGSPWQCPTVLWQFTSIADVLSRQRLRYSSSDDLHVPAVRLPSAYYWTSHLPCCRHSHMPMSPQHHLCSPSENDKLHTLAGLIL